MRKVHISLNFYLKSHLKPQDLRKIDTLTGKAISTIFFALLINRFYFKKEDFAAWEANSFPLTQTYLMKGSSVEESKKEVTGVVYFIQMMKNNNKKFIMCINQSLVMKE